ncbi:hypothetical protein KsCSTR_42860 [Candidatus Kuenenia stuttgartiensis]|uniref:Uncharacterized protein n=1 Tax=Kuenenia stuttgartiensis TaxID=174633 RepID=Q1PX85_KUEST|nr:hypothetical protein KsCSTR_42860 [Candidatus Kuenenia stuttgartiensis]CAJ71844.1 unknown protein [Candidatus Kuenenia stuttgartiensis]
MGTTCIPGGSLHINRTFNPYTFETPCETVLLTLSGVFHKIKVSQKLLIEFYLRFCLNLTRKPLLL